MSAKIHGTHWHLLLFVLVVIFYILYYGPVGYDDADRGYTLAFSWRIFNGELPYRDFIMIKPPLTPYFHTIHLLLPEKFQIISERAFGYILLALSSFFGALTLNRVFNLLEIGINKYFLASIGFIYASTNFPSTSWHAIDAVFFSSAGIFLLSRDNGADKVISGMFFLFLAALCKQPFYLMPLLGIMYVVFVSRSSKKFFIASGSVMTFTLIFIFLLFKAGMLSGFIDQTTGGLKIVDLLKAGIFSYLGIRQMFLVLPVLFWLIIRNFIKKEEGSGNRFLLPYLFISYLMLYPLAGFFVNLFSDSGPGDGRFRDHVASLLFLVTIMYLLNDLSFNKKSITFWFLIILSWTAGISYSYMTPVFFSVPLILGFLLVSKCWFDVKRISNLAYYLLLLGFFVYLIANQKPYLNPPRHQITYRISDMFPKTAFIRVSKSTHEKYTEFNHLNEKYGKNFKTLPGMPLSNYLTNTNSPTGLDWIFNSESAGKNDQLIHSLRNSHAYVFMERYPQKIGVDNSGYKFSSQVAWEIKNSWKKIDSTAYFDVFVPN